MSRKRRRPSRKPTGKIGHLSLDPTALTADFVTVNFPSRKTEIEQYVLDCAITTARKTNHNFYRLTGAPLRNAEQDFDFSLPTESGTEYLDLMEMKPSSGPYQTAPGSYWVWGFAESVY